MTADYYTTESGPAIRLYASSTARLPCIRAELAGLNYHGCGKFEEFLESKRFVETGITYARHDQRIDHFNFLPSNAGEVATLVTALQEFSADQKAVSLLNKDDKPIDSSRLSMDYGTSLTANALRASTAYTGR